MVLFLSPKSQDPCAQCEHLLMLSNPHIWAPASTGLISLDDATIVRNKEPCL